MENKFTVKGLPKKKVSATNGKRDAEIKKNAVSFVRNRQIVNIGLSIVLVLAIVSVLSLVYMYSIGTAPSFLKGIFNFGSPGTPKPNTTEAGNTPVAVVNGEPITMHDLDVEYSIMYPPQYQQFVPKSQVLSQIIDEQILLQRAVKMNLTVSQEEIDQRIQDLMDQNTISNASLGDILASRNLTLQDLQYFYSRRILLGKILNIDVIARTIITDKDIKEYYYNNTAMFKIPESVNVSHIIICDNESISCQSNLSVQDALVKIVDIKNMINDTNFAELAFNYSEEPAAINTYGNLGWVTAEDPYDQTFLNATFKLKAGEVSMPVQTAFGFHLIKVWEIRPPETLNLTNVYSEINQTLAAQKEKDVFDVYMSGLRNESTIVDFLNNSTA